MRLFSQMKASQAQVTVLVWVAIFPVTYELNLYCDGTWCETTNMSCLEQHPHGVESSMCFSNTTAPTIPAGASQACTPCSPPNGSGADFRPEGLRYTLLSVDRSKFRATVQWKMYSTVGLSSFEARVYEMQQLSASLLFCLCLDNNIFTFEFEEMYSKCTQYGNIRVQIISEPYVEGHIDSNMATIQFQCPLQCSDIPSLNFMGCDYVYNDPVVSLSDDGSNGTYVHVSMTHLTRPPPPPISNYYVMVSSESDKITCTNNGMTACFTTNQTTFVLGPLNSSATYQLAVQLYVPCSNGACTNGSIVTIKPPLSPSQPVVTMAVGSPVASQVAPGSFTYGGGLNWVVSSVVMALVIGISVLVVGVIVRWIRRKTAKMARQETDCTALFGCATPYDGAIPGATPHDGAIPGATPHDGAIPGTTPPKDAICNDVTPLDGATPPIHACLPNRPGRSSIFVAYSLCSTSLEQKVILHNLVHQLQSNHQMEVHGHDITTQKGITPYKVEQICQSSVVLCVCNKSFFEEWTAEMPPPQASAVVLIRSLLAADLQRGTDIASKYVTVLMKKGDAHYIPTSYLSSSRQFLVNDVERLAEFIKNIKA